MAQGTNISCPRKGETAGLWFTKLITGPLLIILLFIHMIVNHLVAEGGLMTYNDVIAYFNHPIVVVMEMLFVITVVIHSLLGMRSIILDLNPTRAVLSVVNWVLGLVGVGAIVYGLWLALAIAAQG
jgi:succinate dehydrogenase / fumarate reductase membrane anchor subunit